MKSQRWLRQLTLRIRLVAAFVAVMLIVLLGAGAFVYWRVELALDRTLNGELEAQASTTQTTWLAHQSPDAVIAALPAGAIGQVLSSSGREEAVTANAHGLSLLPSRDLGRARRTIVDVTGGNVLTSGNRRLRVLALPLTRTDGTIDVAVLAVRLGPRDEALRELLAQLAAANLLALAAASLVAYRLARSALLPVERYRARAEQITAGAEGVRLEVPADVDDEVSRLGHTLNQMLTAQERSATLQRQFLADASHELRAPLTLLTSEVELALRRPRSNEEYERTLQQIAEDTARLVVLADQLLDLEQATSPQQDGHADAAVFLTKASAKPHPAHPERRVTASSPAGPVLVPLDPVALEQVLDNLITNALVHGAGEVTAALSTAGPDWVQLRVSDEGAGPPVAFTEHAIERFRRADPARTTPGNGLGLSVVHTLASRAGGELRLCNSGRHHRYPPLTTGGETIPCTHPAEGTHVTVLLPRVITP